MTKSNKINVNGNTANNEQSHDRSQLRFFSFSVSLVSSILARGYGLLKSATDSTVQRARRPSTTVVQATNTPGSTRSNSWWYSPHKELIFPLSGRRQLSAARHGAYTTRGKLTGTQMSEFTRSLRALSPLPSTYSPPPSPSQLDTNKRASGSRPVSLRPIPPSSLLHLS